MFCLNVWIVGVGLLGWRVGCWLWLDYEWLRLDLFCYVVFCYLVVSPVESSLYNCVLLLGFGFIDLVCEFG